MTSQHQNWVKHPTRKHVIISFTVWAVSLAMLGYASDFFTVNINLTTVIMIAAATYTVFRVLYNYRRQQNAQ
jgi:hypothetical protein